MLWDMVCFLPVWSAFSKDPNPNIGCAATSVTPAFASDLPGLSWGHADGADLVASLEEAPPTAPPCFPVDPVTTTVSSCVMFWFLSPAVVLHQMSCGQPDFGGTMCPMHGTIE